MLAIGATWQAYGRARPVTLSGATFLSGRVHYYAKFQTLEPQVWRRELSRPHRSPSSLWPRPSSEHFDRVRHWHSWVLSICASVFNSKTMDSIWWPWAIFVIKPERIVLDRSESYRPLTGKVIRWSLEDSRMKNFEMKFLVLFALVAIAAVEAHYVRVSPTKRVRWFSVPQCWSILLWLSPTLFRLRILY